jgi:Fe-S cluster assembly protein SufD
MSVLTTNILVPHGREEDWRFTPLNRLKGLHDGTAAIAEHRSLSMHSEVVPGVSFERVSRELLPALSITVDAVMNRVREFSSDVAVLKIAANTEVSSPIHLSRKSFDLNAAEFSRVLIHVGSNARATVILTNTGDTLLAEEIEFKVESGAHLTFVTLQEWSEKTVHVGKHHAIVDKDAVFKSITVTIGGSVVRLLPTVEFTGPGADAQLIGVYFATAGQFFEHRIFVDHCVPNAKSRVNFKGALSGDKAHTVWIGDVFIRANAEGTDTYELNRNLLLTDGARADSVPNLEIETGEIVGAGHASTTGRFDDEQLFYLMSRGISVEDARRLVVRGFFAEIITEIADTEIQDRLMQRIDDELVKAGA